MAIKSYKLTNGVLHLGEAGDVGDHMDVSAQMRAVTVKWSENVQSTDAIPVLSGEEIPEEEEATYKATLSGTFLQDLDAAGIIDWTWDNKGLTKAFLFVPNAATERGVEGFVRVTPLDIGGEVAKPATRPTSDFEWACIGDPVFGVYDPVEDLVEEDV